MFLLGAPGESCILQLMKIIPHGIFDIVTPDGIDKEIAAETNDKANRVTEERHLRAKHGARDPGGQGSAAPGDR